MEIHCTAAAWERLQIMAASFFNSTQLIETAWEKFENVDEIQISELRALYLDRIKEQSIKGYSIESRSFNFRFRSDGKGNSIRDTRRIDRKYTNEDIGFISKFGSR